MATIMGKKVVADLVRHFHALSNIVPLHPIRTAAVDRSTSARLRSERQKRQNCRSVFFVKRKEVTAKNSKQQRCPQVGEYSH
jgi:hypothetical protein